MLSSLRLVVSFVLTFMSGIVAAQSSGTAFVVAPGLLVTNHHVIEGCGAIEIIASDGRRPATVVDSVQQIDLALLRVYGLRGGVAALRTQSPALLGESATVFGFPLGGALSSTGNFTTGVVSSLRGLRDAAGEIQITAPVQPGNSGGPVLDRAGAVIGVVQSKLDALRAVRVTGDIPQNVNFAVSLDVLEDFLAKNSVSFKAANRQAALETTQIAEMAQTFTYKISCTAASRTATAPRPQAPVAPAAPTPDKLVQDIQTALNQKGFNAGPADGFIGPQTQAAIVAAQRALGITANGLPSEAFLSLVRKDLPSSGKIAGVRSLPPCAGDVSIWNNCIGSGKWFVSSVSYSVIYSGEWNNGKPNGTGTSVYINGAKYVGEWLDGKHHGQGTLFAHDGTPVMRGLWVNGSFRPKQ